jgi:next-to-BRCA1 protein 1
MHWAAPQQPGQVPNRHLARFVCDVSIDDGTHVLPDQSFVKIWRLRNEGATAWPESTRLAFVGGDNLATTDSVVVPPVAPGAEVDIAVDMKAPTKPGRYVGYWRLVDRDGVRFGQRIWVDVIVASEQEIVQHTPQAEEVPKGEAPKEEPPKEEATQNMEVEPSAPPADAKEADEELSPEMKQLIEMGFQDRDLNAALLAKYNNDVVATLQELLRQ